MQRRTKEELDLLDERIKELYLQGVGCRKISEQLGENGGLVYKRVVRMGIARTRSEHELAIRSRVPDYSVPFQRPPSDGRLSSSALGEAVRWFLVRGYMASIPASTTSYDLVVESDSGLVRVQIKTTSQQNESGLWVVNVSRLSYDSARTGNANGKRHRVPYTEEQTDFFFILTGSQDRYLVPIEAVEGRTSLTLGEFYQKYRVL